MAIKISLLYRGPLRSCNFTCPYCPIEQTNEDSSLETADKEGLDKLIHFISESKETAYSIFFTPLGEVLHYIWYREAIIALSQMEQISKVAVQTNLSTDLSWLSECNTKRTALWCSYHPDSMPMELFLRQLEFLYSAGISYSVGMVGIKKNIPAIKELRQKLEDTTYLWVNAFKHEENYYGPEDIKTLTDIDPLFPHNRIHNTYGKECLYGNTVFSVNQRGDISRCHFIQEPIGNLYQDKISSLSQSAPCTNKTCSCHIGYVHMPSLPIHGYFSDGILERVPDDRNFNYPT